jgi:DNA-directed RNA polymerase specialized sigma subunit
MTEKDMYKQTEKWLYHLDALKTRIQNLKQQYKEKEMEAEGEGIDYSKDKLCQTYKFNSTTENIGLSLVEIHMMIEGLQTRVEIMERSLEMLNTTEKRIIGMKYFKNEPWFNIAYEVQYSERQCRYIRTNAVKKLATAIFGAE